MRNILGIGLVVAAVAGLAARASAAPASTDDTALVAAIRADAQAFLDARRVPEHISAVSVSVNLKGVDHAIDAAVGTARFDGGAAATPASLVQIGSNTKAFTSVALLQLEAEGKLSIEDPLGKWLPQYPAWKDVTIHQLLDMTSGIPGYDGEDSVMADYAAHPMTNIPAIALVAAAYPKRDLNAGWRYTNTAYLLAEMIVEKASGHSYAAELKQRFFDNPALGLHSTYYQAYSYPPAITDRMVSGYFYSTDSGNAVLKPIYGKDVHTFSVSWMQGAGGIVSTPADVSRWTRALYEGPLLADKQRRELETLVSMANGKPIAVTTLADPRGFGLGVGQATMTGLGTFWFYQGETLGYRVLYGWFPKSGAVIVVAANSQPTEKDNMLGKELMPAVYATLKKFGKL
ncbi:MAG TPA: serine hydrolase domain-containing protein [Rhizomicrobium sp.]|nr:serine hydrolase domain-containing protein [Rhizomicrobium sp.]